MKYRIATTKQFDRSVKKCKKRGLNMNLLHDIIVQLENNGKVDDKYKPHKLVGKHIGRWECHIQPDWLLVWEQNDFEFIMLMIQTGTHSDIFG